MTIVYLLLFILCLSTLIMVHELGHLATAKMFKIYCFEYAIGFGPKLIHKKRKNGETYFSLRAIPFGGFVSMYGESETIPEGLTVDPSRSLLAKPKWQRAIVMVAGIVMNCVLALVVFFIYEVGFPKYTAHYAHIVVGNGSKAYDIGLRSGDYVYASVGTTDNASYIFYDTDATLFMEDTEIGEYTMNVYYGFNYSGVSIKDTSLVNHGVAFYKSNIGNIGDLAGIESKTCDQILAGEYVSDTNYVVNGFVSEVGYTTLDEEEYYIVMFSDAFGAKEESFVYVAVPKTKANAEVFASLMRGENFKTVGKVHETTKGYKMIVVENDRYNFNAPDFDKGNCFVGTNVIGSPKKINFTMNKIDEDNPSGKGTAFAFNDVIINSFGNGAYAPEYVGIAMQLTSSRNTYGQAVKQTFVDFGKSATVIFTSLGKLFTDASSWQQVGGIIAIGVVTTRTLQESGFGPFLYYWALISVNLAIVNLLPFPGLDGWHLLVIAVEAIFRKEIPAKFKNWASVIGLILLFGLMILIVIKDVITFI